MLSIRFGIPNDVTSLNAFFQEFANFDCYSSLLGHGIFLEDLFVRPRFRGKGVGRALLAHVARITEHSQKRYTTSRASVRTN